MEIETNRVNTETKTRRVPELSLKAYTAGSAAEKKQFIEGLFAGLKDFGFIILKDHGVEPKTLHRAYELLEKFFGLSTEAKLKYAKVHGGQRGYTPFGQEHAKDSPVMDLKEFWHVGQFLPEGHELSSIYPPNVWPTEIPEFQPHFTKLYQDLESSGVVLLEALTQPLELEQNFFAKMVDKGNSILRLLHYPPIPAGTDPRCLRSAPHEDINLITILPAATAAGLQLKDRDGSWLDVDAEPDTLIVDAGDMLSRITNEVIPSTTHQVVNTPEATHKSRYSMPFFMHPRPEAVLSCIPSCRGTGEKYPPISSHDFLMQRLREIGLLK